MLVDTDCETKVYLREAKYHCEDDCEDKLCTSKIYTIVNVGCGEVKIVAHKNDKIEGCDKHYTLYAGEKVTLQNYKNTFYAVA